MRITGGTARGRKLASPKTGRKVIRPTSDRVREALFNILAEKIPGSMVLDLFAGTGALGIEALSRGAASAVFIDQSRDSRLLVTTNLQTCFTTPRATFIQQRLNNQNSINQICSKLPSTIRFDLIFMDPPYEKKLAEKVLTMVNKAEILAPNGLVVVEEHRRAILPEITGKLIKRDHRTYGETGIWIYSTDSYLHPDHEK